MASPLNILCPLTRPSLSPIVLLAHDRSGSSWIGEILGAAPRVTYCYEPLNPGSRFGGEWEGWRKWIPSGTTNALFEKVFDPVFAGVPPRSDSYRQKTNEFSKRFLKSYRILVKEVGGVLAGEFFQERYGCTVVILVRHPAAVTLSSLKQGSENAKKWQRMILSQPDLIQAFPTLSLLKEPCVCDRLLMLKCVSAVYYVLFQQASKHHWPVIFYEGFCENPQVQSADLFALAGLSYSKQVKSLINERSSHHQTGMYSTGRDSKKMIDRWREGFTAAEIAEMFCLHQQFQTPWYACEDQWFLSRGDQCT